MWQEGDSKSGSDKFVESDEKQEQKSEIVEDDIKEKEHKKIAVNDDLETKTHEDSLTAGNAHFPPSLCTAKKEISSDMEGERERELNFKRRRYFSSIKGVNTVLCIDTSDTMKLNDAWDQTKAFVNDYGSENTKLSGGSKLEAGLRFSKNAVISLDNYVFNVNKTRISPRIVVITDGRAVVQNQSKVTGNEEFNRLKEEMTGIREMDIETHFVYVGDPDYIFLHKLREISAGELLPHTSGPKVAKDAVFKCILHDEKDFLTSKLKNSINENDASTKDVDGDIGNVLEEMLQLFFKDDGRLIKRLLNETSAMKEMIEKDQSDDKDIDK
ncbi:uncharacterized protein LOC132719055, partial [Ruditapes philippinarum]|uniref:uncharacterized protein LOC132719055 n=1 Tax=Ruditapes philippinarum TaxID=129788 RepID=UPI00295A6BF1